MSSIQNITNTNPWQQPTTSGSSASGSVPSGTDAQTTTNLLDAAGSGQSWGPAFDQAVQATNIGNAVANNAGVVPGSNIPQLGAAILHQDRRQRQRISANCRDFGQLI